ncbi:hypothetical protein BOX15_Mlig010623g2 [Macrostomum lignano]|uniref:BTB domain-containing protein n=2 Tax=Macrostomum lignano TaxID=282301 RepID=A0A267FW50_9PLAT|nr:hypothetical protein BOX15_Mlig010623g2 [Macrostomum lignano]
MKALASSNGRRNSRESAKFVISRPIGTILRDPLQLKVLVPKSGRSVEHKLSGALRTHQQQQQQQQLQQQQLQQQCQCHHEQCQQPPPVPAAPTVTCTLISAHDAIHVSIQSKRESSDCRTHFDLVMRLLQPRLRAAHLLCKVMYRNIRDEVKEMGPYLLGVTEPVCCYRLEEMNCQVSPKTNHYHVYLALQLVSVEPVVGQCCNDNNNSSSCNKNNSNSLTADDNSSRCGAGGGGDGEPYDCADVESVIDDLASLMSAAATPPRSTRSRHQSISSSASVSLEEPLLAMSPVGTQLPDFTVKWSPLATLKISTDSSDSESPLYCVPQLLCLCSEMFSELLMVQRPGGAAGEAGELVVPGVAKSDLLLLLQLIHPGTPCTVNLANVQQVLSLAAKFRVPHLRSTADQLLCRSVHASPPVSASRRQELCSLATQYSLPCLAELLRLRLSESEN